MAKQTEHKRKAFRKYVTHNLDESAFLCLNGFKCTQKTIDTTSAKFFFVHTPAMERTRKIFWTKGAKVNLHSWLAMRQGLKNELKGQLKVDGRARATYKEPLVAAVTLPDDDVLTIPVSNQVPFMPKIAQKYFVVLDKGVITSYVYGHRPIHKNRADAAKCYRTKPEALAASHLIP